MLAPAETAEPSRPSARLARVAALGVPRLVELAAFAIGTVLAVVLAIDVLGVAGGLVLLGAWLLAAACHRVVPGLTGSVSWAAGVLLEVGLLTVISALTAKVSPHQHGSGGTLVQLALPVLIAVVALAVGVLLDRRAGAEPARSPARVRRVSARPGLALTVVVAGLALVDRISGEGHLYGVAWAMSGDARNHVVIIRSVLDAGGITVNLLRNFPGVIDSIAAMISGGGGRAHLAPGHLMVHDAQSLVTTYVLSGLAVAVLGIAALLEFLPRAVTAASRLPLPAYVALLGSIPLSDTGLVLGTALHDGYVSAYATLPLTLAAVVLGLVCCRQGTPAAYALLGPAMVLTLFSWTILAVAPAAITVVVTLLLAPRAWRRLRGGNAARGVTGWWAVSLVVTGGCTLGGLGVVLTHLDQLKKTFTDTGAITSPNLHLIYLFGFLALGGALGAGNGLDRLQMLVPLSAAAAGGLTLHWLIGLSPDGKSWTYYAIKMLWLLAAGLVWLLFVPIVRASAAPWATGRAGRPYAVAGRLVAAAAWSIAALVGVGLTTPLPGPLTLAGHGWNQPTAGVIADVETALDSGRPVLLWGWSDGGNERLGNFWSALAWAYGSDESITNYAPALGQGGVVYWAYVEQGTPADLCHAAESVPNLVVLTHTKNLAASLKKACPGTRATVATNPDLRS